MKFILLLRVIYRQEALFSISPSSLVLSLLREMQFFEYLQQYISKLAQVSSTVFANLFCATKMISRARESVVQPRVAAAALIARRTSLFPENERGGPRLITGEV